MNWDELFSNRLDYDPATGERLALPGGGGVYLFTDEQDRFIQLSSAADLKRAITNRLAPSVPADSPPTIESPGGSAESPASSETLREAPGQAAPDVSKRDAEPAGPGVPSAEGSRVGSAAQMGGRRRADLSQIVRRIRWQPAHSAFEIAAEYLRISRVVLPDTYLENLAFGPAWFVHLDPAAEIPRFSISKMVPAEPGSVLGPFATQQDANKFVQILEDVFDLCRYVHILEQAPHGQPCAYYEMGRCPAPCGGLIPMAEYRQTMQAALSYAAGERDAARQEWEAQMRQAAGELAFERAAAVKQRLARAGELEHAAYRYVRPLEQFNWLIVQRGPGRTRVKPFFVRGGRLHSGPEVRLKGLDEAVPAWVQGLGSDWTELPADHADLKEISENIWLLSHFLLRREQAGLFFDAAGLPATGQLVETIRDHFAAKSAEASDQQQQTPSA